MESPFSVTVTDLLGRPGARRRVSMHGQIEIALDQVKRCGPLSAEVGIESIVGGVAARVVLQAEVIMECNRCLTEVTRPVEARFMCAYMSGPQAVDDDQGGDRVEYGLLDSDGRIDFGPALRDELSLAVPLVTLCSQECRGICPVCGNDLNVKPCHGHEDLSDSPFGQLKNLFDRL